MILLVISLYNKVTQCFNTSVIIACVCVCVWKKCPYPALEMVTLMQQSVAAAYKSYQDIGKNIRIAWSILNIFY